MVQLLVGYEWLMSGPTKAERGDFASGLADELRDKLQGAAGWYKGFLDGAVIPHASAFGYLIEIGELLIGLALVAAALIWLFRWERLPQCGRPAILATTAFASFAAILMAICVHLANGAPHPWLIAEDGFDEGIDLDSVLPAIHSVLIGVSVALCRLEWSVAQAMPRRSSVKPLERSLT